MVNDFYVRDPQTKRRAHNSKHRPIGLREANNKTITSRRVDSSFSNTGRLEYHGSYNREYTRSCDCSNDLIISTAIQSSFSGGENE
jgi:hypothetical protein